MRRVLPLTRRELNDLYDESNRTRFEGRLPKVPASWTPPRNTRLVAVTHGIPARKISISPVYGDGESRDKVREWLLHEMAHVEVAFTGGESDHREHGAQWRAAMRRLYAQGEKWVPQQLRNAAVEERNQDRLLAPLFKEIIRLPPMLRWNAVSEHLLKKFGTRRSKKFGLSAKVFIEEPGNSTRLFHFWSDRFQSLRHPLPVNQRCLRCGGQLFLDQSNPNLDPDTWQCAGASCTALYHESGTMPKAVDRSRRAE